MTMCNHRCTTGLAQIMAACVSGNITGWCFVAGLSVTALSAQAQLAPIPEQALSPPPTAEQEAISPLPGANSGLAPIPFSGTSKDGDAAALITEKDRLRETYNSLKSRLQQATDQDQPVTAETSALLLTAQDRLKKIELMMVLAEWQRDSAERLLQTINGRPIGVVQKLPVGTAVAPKLMKTKLPANAFTGPSNDTAPVLSQVLPIQSPILQIASVADGVWILAWVPGHGYGYIQTGFIEGFGEDQ